MFRLSLGHMPLGGRTEKRIPLAVPVYLVSTKELRVVEKAMTENVSPHGARVVTKQPWESGEQPRLSRRIGDFQLSAQVVYCQPLTDGNFCVGLEFRSDSMAWEEVPGQRNIHTLRGSGKDSGSARSTRVRGNHRFESRALQKAWTGRCTHGSESSAAKGF